MNLNRSLITLAWPMILANLAVAILGLVDTAIIGHLDGPQYLGGVALATVVFDFLFWGFAFLRIGTVGRVAQFFGEQETHKIHIFVVQMAFIAVVVSVIVLATSSIVASHAFPLLDGSQRVKDQAVIYFQIKVWGAPALFLQYVLIGTLIGLQNTRGPMWTAIVLNIVNVVLDVVFVFGFGWSIRGVAYASVIAEYTAMGVIFFFLVRELPIRITPELLEEAWRPKQILGHLNFNLSLFLRTLCLIFTFAYFTNQSAALSDEALAANAVLLKFLLLISLGLDGFANALEALVGRYLGAGDHLSLRRVVRLGQQWSLSFAVLLSTLFFAVGVDLIRLMSDVPSVVDTATRYLGWLVVLPLVTVWPFLYDGIFIGATKAKEMMVTMAFATFGVFMPVWFLTRGLGNHGLWLAFTLFFASRGISLAILWARSMRTYHSVSSESRQD